MTEEEGEKEEENKPEKQEMLETRLQEAESFVEESKQTAREMEAVVAALRDEQVRVWRGALHSERHIECISKAARIAGR